MYIRLTLSILITLSTLICPISYANSLQVSLANDFINNTDRHLTNSVNISYMTDVNSPYYDAFKLSFDHNIYTPDNIDLTDKSEFDMPYAGEVITQYSIYKKNEGYYNALGFVVGFIGEKAYGEQIQKAVHKLISVAEPQGWKYQVGHKNIVGLNYDFGHQLHQHEFMSNDFNLAYRVNATYTTTRREAHTQIELKYGSDFSDYHIDKQINLTKTNGWDIGVGFVYSYTDYDYIIDDFKDEYNISKKNSAVAEYIMFNFYRQSSIYGVDLTTADFEMMKGELTETWINFEYTQLF